MKIDNKIAKELKKDFPIFSRNLGLVYLDNAATSQRPKAVINALVNFYEKDNANPGRSIHTLAERAMSHLSQARKVVADFIGADSQEIIFTRNATDALNLAAHIVMQDLPKGRDEILLTEMEHHSNLVPWQQLAQEKGMKLKFVQLTPDFTLDMNDLAQKLTKKTAVFAFSAASNVLGTVNDIRLLAKLAKEKGALSVVDASQAVQHIPINVHDLGTDFLAFSSHKMLGPTGLGVLYGKKDLLKNKHPSLFGGGMIKHVAPNTAEFTETPERFEAGTQNVAGAAGLAESIKYLKNLGLANISSWEEKLRKYTLARLEEIPGIKIYHPKQNAVPVISFTLPKIHPHDIASLLNQKKIAIRAGHQCAMPLMSILHAEGGVCRASLSFYNTFEDIDALVDALKEIKEKFK